jgi:energy-converting hydrogenase Eha subunit A
MAFASLVIAGVFAVLPDLAADYGAERSFLFSLILTAPMLAVGSAQIFSFFGQRWKILGGTFIALAIFVSTIGLMPQLTGGYASQLTLNANSQYADTFYVRPQDVAAAAWLSHYPDVINRHGYDINAPFSAVRFAFTSPTTIPYMRDIGDIYPTVVLATGWTILDYSITHGDAATAFVGVTAIDYKYPIGLLATTKNLVYNNGATEIYK